MEKPGTNIIRVVVVDDSPTERLLINSLFTGLEGMAVVGTGSNGLDAINLSEKLRPDIILMDVIMPKVSGLEATGHIMHEHPTPIILMSSNPNSLEMNLMFEAERAGALTALIKPSLNDSEACENFLRTVRAMARVPLVRRWNEPKKRIPAHTGTLPALITGRERKAFTEEQLRSVRMVGIAASTGGPSTLITVLQSLRPDFPLPLLIVQHISKGFGSGLADWLDDELEIAVRIGQEGETPRPGTAYLAPDDFHIELASNGTIHLHQQAPFRGLRPSANYLFQSMTRVCGKQALGIILTGMGDDGAEGMLQLYKAGALTAAQDRQSCVVYGMPKEAIELGAIEAVLSPEQINFTLQQLALIQASSPRGGNHEKRIR